MKRFITLITVAVFMLSATAQPFLVGHRGSYWGVENTEEAFINGAKKGYHYLETDIKVTKDGKFVCWHDDALTKASDQPTINANTLATLQSKKLTQTRGGVTYTGYLTTLERYLDICKEYGVYPVIEFKWADGINSNDQSNIPALIKIVEEKGFRNSCYIFTSMKNCLTYVKNNYPDIQIMLLVYSSSFDSSLSWCKTNKSHIGPGVGDEITKAGVQAYHDAGLLVNAWTCNTNSAYETYGNYGCDFITTDYLDPANLPALSTPTTMTGAIKADKNSVTLTAGVGETSYADITVTGSNMSSALTVTSSNSQFSIANNTTLSSGSINGTVRISYTPTVEGVTTGTITLKATNKAGSEVTTSIAVTGKCSLNFTEVWNYSETSGNAPSSGENWASDKSAMRNIAYGNGKLYIVKPSYSTITIVDAQEGTKIKDLNTTGVADGTFTLMDAEVVGNKLVACNLTTASATTLKAYVWDTDDSAPREILNTTDLGGCTRVGDCLDVQGDLTNGALLFLSGSNIVKYPITNGVVATSPTVIAVTKEGSALDAGTSPRVIAQSDGKYWIIGRSIYPTLVSSSGTVELTLGSDVLNGVVDGNDFYPFIFKGKQYAFATTYATGSTSLSACRAVLIDASNGWDNAINVGEYPTSGLGTTRNTSLSTGIEIDVNGTEGVEMWVNCNTQGIAHYKYGKAKIHTTDPVLSVDKTSLSLETTVGYSASNTITVTGLNLEDNIYLAISGDDADLFSISANAIDQLASNGIITVTYTPKSEGTHSATMSISSANATTIQVELSGVCTPNIVLEDDILKMTEVWNFGENTTSASWMTVGAKGTTRYIAENGGNLCVLNCVPWGAVEIKIIDAYTGEDTGNTVNVDGVSVGLTKLSSIRFVDGVLVGANAANANHTFTVYAWKDGVSSAPTKILEDATHGGLIMGSNISISGTLDKGYIWATDDTVKNVIRYEIAGGVVNTTPTVIPLKKNGVQMKLYGSRGAGEVVPNDDGTFWVVGQSAYPILFNADGTYNSEMQAGALNNNNHGTAMKLFTFGEKKYAVAVSYTTGQANGYFTLIDVTNGAAEATTYKCKYPEAGLGSTANDQNMSSICQSTRKDGMVLDIWVCCARQGVAHYTYNGERFVGVEENIADEVSDIEMTLNINGSSLIVEGVDADMIQLYSVNGACVRSNLRSSELSIDGLNGLYIIAVKDIEGNSHTAKLVIR